MRGTATGWESPAAILARKGLPVPEGVPADEDGAVAFLVARGSGKGEARGWLKALRSQGSGTIEGDGWRVVMIGGQLMVLEAGGGPR